MNYRVKATGLNVRARPDEEAEVLFVMQQGEIFEAPDGWLPVLLEDGDVGWVSAAFVEEAPEEEETASEAPATSGDYDFSDREGAIAAIKAECVKQGLSLPEQIAYVLATVEWETARTFKPVREAYWKDEDWRRRNLARYYPYYGRGFVQLTWKGNYQKYAEKTGLDLVSDPDLAMEPETALCILVDGFKTGAFTGKKLTDYINDQEVDFINARRCINGVDKAREIAALAEKYCREVA